MKILALDTTAKTATAALAEDGKLTAFTVMNTTNTHSVTLIPIIDNLLRCSEMNIKDIDLFVCSAGPGSFTGVRVGVATVKGFAYAAGKPCIGVSSLEALAMNVISSDGIVCPVMDARRGQLYNALFRYDGNGLSRLTCDRVITAGELADGLKKLAGPNDKVYLTGDGLKIAETALTGFEIAVPHEILKYHNAYNVALLGYKIYSESDSTERAEFTAEKLSPVYLRASQAERERLERLSKENPV